jgi:hypothetical protein
MRRFLAIALIMTALPIASARAAVKAERVEYHGWRECWKISIGTVDLVFVPSIGRIMRYGYIGKPNMLWEKPEMRGKLPDPAAKDWQNFGGDKLWPAPQTAWGWPPYHDIDPGSHEVKLIRKSTLLIIGKPSAKAGIRFEREITMDDKGTGVRIVNRMINTSSKPQKWALWEITQVDDPEIMDIPASPVAIHKDGFYSFPDNLPAKGQVSTTMPGWIRIQRARTKSAKVGSYSNWTFASAYKSGSTFEIWGNDEVAPSGEYPHGGNSQEVYTNPDPDKYAELEILRPVSELKPLASAEMKVRWELRLAPNGPGVRP